MDDATTLLLIIGAALYGYFILGPLLIYGVPQLHHAVRRTWHRSRLYRAIEDRRFRRWWESLTPEQQAASTARSARIAADLGDAVSGFGLSAAEAEVAFSAFHRR